MGFTSVVSHFARVHPSRLASAPVVRVVEREGTAVRLAVDGLVCGVCAARTRAALSLLPGVEDVRVDLDRGTAELTARGEVSEAALTRALASVVVGARARRWIERGVASWRTRMRGGRA